MLKKEGMSVIGADLALSLLTKKEAAKVFSISQRTLDRWRSEGLLKAFKIGHTVRFAPNDLQALLTKKTKA